jgi:hypothetical protein
VPKPSVKNLLFGTTATLKDGLPAPATLPVGAAMIYASVDVAALPADARIEWRLSLNGSDLFDDRERVTQTTCTLTRTLFASARNILPGDYRLVVIAANQMVDGHFVISADEAAAGTTLMFDNFDDNTLNWDLSIDPRLNSAIKDGQLRMEVKDPAKSVFAAAEGLTLEDFDYTISVKAESGTANGWVSLWFRFNSSGGYLLDLYNDGTFRVGTGTAAAYKPVVDIQRAASYKRGAVNTLRLVGQGDLFALYINDEEVTTFKDTRYASGQFALGVNSARQGGVVYTFDNLLITTPRDKITLKPTPTKAPTVAAPAGTPRPTVTKAAATPPLGDTIKRVRNAVEAIGGAMDRIYHGSGAESCGAFMESYLAIIGAPKYDVSAQPANVQGAYGQYRQAVEYIAGSKVTQIANICLQGGGNIGALDFNEARQAVNTAGSWLAQALSTLGL